MIKEHIVKTSIHSEWTLYGAIDSFDTYKELIDGLQEAQDGDGIMLKINCPGGDCSVGFMIVQAIRETKATVVCNVVYPSMSLGAIIAVAGDYLIMQPHSYLMFHTYSAMDCGKSADLMKSVIHSDESLKGMMSDVCVPFLTKIELKKMHAGDDIYIKASDATLPARIKRHYKDVQIG